MTEILISSVLFLGLVFLAILEKKTRKQGECFLDDYAENENRIENKSENECVNRSGGNTFLLLVIIILLVAILHEQNPDFLNDFYVWVQGIFSGSESGTARDESVDDILRENGFDPDDFEIDRTVYIEE